MLKMPVILARSIVPLLLVVLLAAGSLPAADRPNIVVLMADDMGFSDIGCYGGEIPTPNIDALAADGMRFTQFYNTSRCCPTRASLLTGLYPHEAGIGHMVYANKGEGYLGYLNDQCATLAEVLRPAGYQTLMTGKWHVGHRPGQWPVDRGFDSFYGIHIHVDSYFKVLRGCPVYHNDQLVIPATADPPNTLNPDQEWYSTDVFTDWALHFLDEADSERPFLLYLAYNAPHFPLEAPAENIAHFRGKYLDGWDRLRDRRLERLKQLGIVPSDTELPPSENLIWDELNEEDQKELDFRRAIYAAQIERMDANIGRVIDKLRELGTLENTLILFLSDNGCSAESGQYGLNWDEYKIANYDHWRKKSGWSVSQGQAWASASNTPFRLYKRWVHEGGIATPLIARWPAAIRDRGSITGQVGHVIDLMATCVDVAGAQYPEQKKRVAIRPMRGISLQPAFRNPRQTEPRTIYWEHETHAAIRDGDWKLVTKDASDADAWELYDLSRDRVELQNLAAEQPERVRRLSARWADWAEQTNVIPFAKDRPRK